MTGQREKRLEEAAYGVFVDVSSKIAMDLREAVKDFENRADAVSAADIEANCNASTSIRDACKGKRTELR